MIFKLSNQYLSTYRTLQSNIFKCEEKVTKIWRSTDLSIEFGNFFFCTFADDALLFMGRSPCCTEGNCLLSENTWPSNTLKFLFLQKSEEGFQFSISKCNGPSHLSLLFVKHLYYSHCRPDELAPYYNNLICNVFQHRMISKNTLEI